ncbi:MAG: hypothetical protein QOG03_1484 [Actinomycetota bacterium]|nr:hypothetical protein [Actinomycetota bacterium]
MRFLRSKRMLMGVAAAAAGLFLMVGGIAPSGAAPGAGGSQAATVFSPSLNSKFPCAGGGGGQPLDAIGKYPSGAAAGYSCAGTIYSTLGPGTGRNVTTFVGGASGGGHTFSFAGQGALSGNYGYTEPCQTGPDGSNGATYGDAQGTLTITVTGTGLFDTTPITSATISSGFWWSRVGLSAVIGLKGATVTTSAGSVSDPGAQGISAAAFIPASGLPDCSNANIPAAGSIVISSGALTLG